jgi:hypothetical protein
MRATLHAHPWVKPGSQVIAGTGIIALTGFEHHDFYFLKISTSYEPPAESWHYHPLFYPVIARHGSWAGGKRYPGLLKR